MLKALDVAKDFSLRIYTLGKMSADIERAFKRYFERHRVYYFFETCPVVNEFVDGVCGCNGGHEIIWVGRGLRRFVKKAQRYATKHQDAPVLFCTPLPTKGAVEDLRKRLDEAYKGNLNQEELDAIEREYYTNEYWIGDVARGGEMICCDGLWFHFWNLMKGDSDV